MASPGQPVTPPWDGAVPAAAGLASEIRIPFPGPGKLVLSLRPQGFKGSTSTIFIMKDKYKGLRLDYGPNTKTNCVDYHWNLQGNSTIKQRFLGMTDHMPAGTTGKLLYNSAKAFRYVGRPLIVIGFVVDAISIVEASNPLRRSTEVVSAWAMAAAGARVGGMVGARVGAIGGSFVEPVGGTAVGGIVFGFLGAAVGAYEGYKLGEKAGDVVYDWAADTKFAPLPMIPLPADPFAAFD